MDWTDLADDIIQTTEFEFPEIKPNVEISEKYDFCQDCNIKMTFNNKVLLCRGCGKQSHNFTHIAEDEYSVSAYSNCNVNSSGYTSFTLTGNGSKAYQRSMFKTCAVYNNYRKMTTLRHMNNWNNRGIGVEGSIFIPKFIINQANEEYDKIKKHKYVYRNEGKDGVLSALIYYACYNAGITKTPAEIAKFSGIEEKFHSLGDRILHELHEKKIIQIPVKIYPIPDYVDRYINVLNIPKEYRQFILDIIDRAEKKKIHVIHDSKATTRVIGTIYLLTTRIKDLKHITKELIEEQCHISKATFLRYFATIHAYYKKFKKVFKRHRIPMPIEWSKNYQQTNKISKPKRIPKIKKVKPIKIKKPRVVRNPSKGYLSKSKKIN